MSVFTAGAVSAKTAGSAIITVTINDGVKSAICSIKVTSPSTNMENGHELLDLGLPSGLKWVTCNFGALAHEEYGDYFVWGETLPKSNYGWSTYGWCNGEYNKLTGYNTNISF